MPTAALHPATLGLAVIPEGAEPGSGARRHRLRRVLRLFQLLPDGVGPPADGAVLPAGHRTAQTRDRHPALTGFFASKIRTVFLLEGAALAVAGAAVGIGVALAYGALILLGLSTWWFDAVGTRLLSLHASVPALTEGATAGVPAGPRFRRLTLRGLEPDTPRDCRRGKRWTLASPSPKGHHWRPGAAWSLVAAGRFQKLSPGCRLFRRRRPAAVCPPYWWRRPGCTRGASRRFGERPRWGCATWRTARAAAFCASP